MIPAWQTWLIKQNKTSMPVIGSFVVLPSFLVLIALLIQKLIADNPPARGFEWLTLVVSFLTLVVYIWTLVVLNQTLQAQQQATKLQWESSERTARMEQAKVLMEVFSQNELYEAIAYFLNYSPSIYMPDGAKDTRLIDELRAKPETAKHRYRLMTALHHAERLYQTEKADTALFTSLITPDIVEVTLHVLHTLDGYTNGTDKPVYEMIYHVFAETRRSYLEPYRHAFTHQQSITGQNIEKTRRLLNSLLYWDKTVGTYVDELTTQKDLILLDMLIKNLTQAIQEADTALKRYKDVPNKTTELDKIASSIYLYRGNAKHEQGNTQEAIQDFDTAIKLDPKYTAAYTNRGYAKYELDQYAEAIQDYDIAIKLDTKNVLAYNNRGIAKAELCHYTEAIQDFDTAIKLDPKNALAYNNRGVAKGKLGDTQGAEADFETFKRLIGKDSPD
ncbi:MAG: tetratricopeptide repeat protein [Vampirovibrionales bacterium]